MPSINQCKEIIKSITFNNPKAVVCVLGKPGMGKSDSQMQVAEEYVDGDMSRVLRVHINNHDVVDFTGVPQVVDGLTKFAPTEMFHRFRTGTGKGVIILEEVPQSSVAHQTWCAGFSLERETPTFELDDEVIIMMNGNRAQDKSGAKQMLKHLEDRLYLLECETSLDDWTDWALENDVPTEMIAFMRLRPDLLNNFDPQQKINATQRSWSQLAFDVPMNMPRDLYLYACEGKVGEGPAAEWVSAKDLMDKMPSPDFIRAQPEKAEIPSEPAVKFAVSTALATSTTEDNFSRTMEYVDRMPKEFQMVYVNDAIKKHAELQQTRDFIQWAVKNKDIFMGE